MKTRPCTAMLVLMQCLIIWALAPPVFAADKGQGSSNLTEVKQGIREAFKDIENYSAARKEAFLKSTDDLSDAFTKSEQQLEPKKKAK